MVVVVAIIAVLSTLAYSGMSRYKPRATLSSAAAELQSLIHEARQSALANGQHVAVLFFPAWTGGTSTGRVIVYRDGTLVNGDYAFFAGTGANDFSTYNPSVLAADSGSAVLEHMELPRGVTFGPSTGMGATPLKAPRDQIVVSSDCSFCSTGTGRRGAILFDEKGKATFHGGGGTLDATVSVNGGASLSLQSSDVTGSVTFVILSETGVVQVINNG
jgi:type II secretory pathway pseudopilin PulG